jgi:outer membrane murein-binding lipoprotein Lpp
LIGISRKKSPWQNKGGGYHVLAMEKILSSCRVSKFLLAAGVLLALSGCADQETKKEVQTLKTEVAALKNKLNQLETGQKQILDTMQGLQKPKEIVAPPAAPAPAPLAMPGAAPLAVGQLIKDKDRLIGTRVTVKGEPGPVLMHKKILYLQSPEGMVEVLFGNLADKKQMERLTAQAIEQPLTVTGMLSASPGRGKDPTRLQITAEAIDF